MANATYYIVNTLTMKKTDLSCDKIVLLDNDELEAMVDYSKNNLDDKEKENIEEARIFYLKHMND
jgi:hypothetical protein